MPEISSLVIIENLLAATSPTIGDVGVMDLTGRQSAIRLAVGTAPIAGAGSETGELWVADELGGAVIVVDPRGGELISRIELDRPTSIALCHEQDSAAVGLRGSKAVAIVDMATKSVRMTIEIGAEPGQISCGPGSSVFVLGERPQSVFQVDSLTGNVVRVPIEKRIAGSSPRGALGT